MRPSSSAAALIGASLLLLGAPEAYADPSFVLTESAAGPGESVHFSISGTESRATYSLEVDGEEVGEGSVASGSSVSSAFAMPDLGDATRAVTVEARIVQSDETITRARTLQYLAPPQPSQGPTEPPTAPAPTPGPEPQSAPASRQEPATTTQSTPASGPRPRSRRRELPASHPAPERRNTRRSPSPAPERNFTRPRPRHRLGPHGSSRTTKAGDAGPRSSRPEAHRGTAKSEAPAPSRRHESAGTDLTTGLKRLVGIPRPLGIFSLASGVAGGDGAGIVGSGGLPIVGLIVLSLLAVSALMLAILTGGRISLGRRPAGLEGVLVDDSGGRSREILRRFVRVPRSRNSFGTLPRSPSPPVDPSGWAIEGPATLPPPGSEEVAPEWLLRRPEEAEIGDWVQRGGEPVSADGISPALLEAAASFAPIPLAVLDERATLAVRSERKYFLDPGTFERLLGELIPYYLILEIDGERVFPYDTVYFDTPERMAYYQHLQRRRKRFKCRTRLYSPTGLCYFEVKLKGGRGETIKRRLELAAEEHGSLTSPTLTFLERELHQVYGSSPPTGLAPALHNHYRRLTLVGRGCAERLTFDFELVFAVNGREHRIQPGRILLETKADSGAGEASTEAGAGEANRALQRLGVRPVENCSKYCLGVALAHPEARSNPFRRLIRHHFEAPAHLPPRPRQ